MKGIKRSDYIMRMGVGIEEIDPAKELLRAMHPHRFSERVQDWYLHPAFGSSVSLFVRPTRAGGTNDVLLQAAFIDRSGDASG